MEAREEIAIAMPVSMETLRDTLHPIAVPAYKTVLCHFFHFESSSEASKLRMCIVDSISDRVRELRGSEWNGLDGVTFMSFKPCKEVKVFVITNQEENTLILCGVGPVGNYGHSTWNDGLVNYKSILNAVENIITTHGKKSDMLKRGIVCPDCLANPEKGVLPTMWSQDHILKHVSGNNRVQCRRGHTMEPIFLLGSSHRAGCCAKTLFEGKRSSIVWNPCAPNPKLEQKLPGVVLIVVYGESHGSGFETYGSGFVACAKRGLIITAAHVLFNMETKKKISSKDPKIYIVVHGEDSHFVDQFYSAEIVAIDLHNVDACVLRVNSKNKNTLQALTITSEPPEKETLVTLVGFKQTGLEISDEKPNRTTCISRGYLEKQCKSRISIQSDEVFLPKEETVVRDCPNYSGQSGGPVFNKDGNVVGILSRGDHIEENMCYLVPHNELNRILQEAKSQDMKNKQVETIFVFNKDVDVKESIWSEKLLSSRENLSNSRSGGNDFKDMISAIKDIEHIQSQLFEDRPEKTAIEVVKVLKDQECTFVARNNESVKIIEDENEIERFVCKKIKTMKKNNATRKRMTSSKRETRGEGHCNPKRTPSPRHSSLVPSDYWSSEKKCKNICTYSHKIKFKEPKPETLLQHLVVFSRENISGSVELICEYLWDNAIHLKFFERCKDRQQVATEIFIEISDEGLVVNAKWHIAVNHQVLDTVIDSINNKISNSEDVFFPAVQLNNSTAFVPFSSKASLEYIVSILQEGEMKGTGFISETGLVVTSSKIIKKGTKNSLSISMGCDSIQHSAKMLSSSNNVCILDIEDSSRLGKQQGFATSKDTLKRDASISVKGLIRQDDRKIKDVCIYEDGGYLCMIPISPDLFVIHCYRSHYSRGSPVFDGNGELIGIIDDFKERENHRYYVKSAHVIQQELNNTGSAFNHH